MTYILTVEREMFIAGMQVHGDCVHFSAETLEAVQKNPLLPSKKFDWQEVQPGHYRALVEIESKPKTDAPAVLKRWTCSIDAE